MLMHGKTREPPSTKWIVMVCTASFLLYLGVWWISAPSSSSSSTTTSPNDEPRVFVSQERYLQQAETIVGRLVRLNPLELRAQLQTVMDQLDALERSPAEGGEAKQALTREPRDLVDQYLALTRTATKSMSDLVQLVSELKAEYHIQRLNAVV